RERRATVALEGRREFGWRARRARALPFRERASSASLGAPLRTRPFGRAPSDLASRDRPPPRVTPPCHSSLDILRACRQHTPLPVDTLHPLANTCRSRASSSSRARWT